MAKLARVHVTPRDAIDCNQLVSLTTGLTVSGVARGFRVGQRCLIWLNINKFSDNIDVGNTWAEDFWDAPTVSINELAQQLKLWGI